MHLVDKLSQFRFRYISQVTTTIGVVDEWTNFTYFTGVSMVSFRQERNI